MSLLSEMIAFAKHDNHIKSVEYNFLLAVSRQLEISREDFDYLIEHPVNYIHLKTHSERIVQFHRLILLMNINGTPSAKVKVKLYNYGLRMGLNFESINKVLFLMENFPNRLVPTGVLIDIFKLQYN
ncbi:TerB family tellurite resistance protein [Bizionia sediminis]|uniref:TerB family tellurite resistance protein n=1 Tax=Bizionia sediminis TaxID=1737064 RepID=A0ABW5KQZ2_9FLAO